MMKTLHLLLGALLWAATGTLNADPVTVIQASDEHNLYGGATGLEAFAVSEPTPVTFLDGATGGGWDFYLAGPVLLGKIEVVQTGEATLGWQAIKNGQVIDLWTRHQDGLYDLSGNQVVADHLRLVVTGANLGTVTLAQVQVFGEDPGTLTHRVMPTAVRASAQSSFFHGPSNLFDGDSTTAWKVLRPEDTDPALGDLKTLVRQTWPQWWQDWSGAYDSRVNAVLPAGKRLAQVQIGFGPQAQGSVDVMGLFEGQWRLLGTLEAAPGASAVLANPYPNDLAAEVQLIVRSPIAPVAADLTEVLLWGNGNASGDAYFDPVTSGVDTAGNRFGFYQGLSGQTGQKWFEFAVDNQGDAQPEVVISGQRLTGITPYAQEGERSFYKVAAGDGLWGQNLTLILVEGVTGEWQYGRAHLHPSDGSQNWSPTPGVLDDGWKFLPVATSSLELTPPASAGGATFQTYGDGSLLAQQSGLWVEPPFMPTADGKLYGPWPDTSANPGPQSLPTLHSQPTLQILPGSAGLAEVRLSGAGAQDSTASVRILWPANGAQLTNAQVLGHHLVGQLSGSVTNITVNGRSVQTRGNLFWIPLAQLGLQKGMNRVEVEARGTNAPSTDSTSVTSAIGVGLEIGPLWKPGIGTGTTNSSQDTYRLTGQSLVPDTQVFVGTQAAVMSGGQFTAEIPLETGLNTLPLRLVWMPTGAVLEGFDAKILNTAQGIMLTVNGEGATTFVNQPSYQVSGTVTATNRVRLSVNGLPVMVNGSFFATTLTLVQGLNTVTVTASDASRSVTKTVGVYYDTHLPELTLTAPTAGAWYSKTLPVAGTVTDAGPDSVWANGVRYNARNGSFAFAIPLLQEGQFTFSFQPQNRSGTLGEVLKVTFGVDSTPPVSFAIGANVTGWTSNNRPTLSFATTDATSGVHHYDYSLNQGTSWTLTASPLTLPVLPDGVNTVLVRAVDNAGNVRVQSIDLRIDTTPPLAVTNLRAIPGTGTMDVAWATDDTDVIRYYVTREPAWSDGVRTFTTPAIAETDLANGEVYQYTVWAEDRAYNVGPTALTQQGITGLAVAGVIATAEVTVAEYKNLKVVVPVAGLPEGTTSVIIKETVSPALQEISTYPIVSPIYSISTLALADDGDLVETAHTELSQDVMIVLDYDASLLPNGFPETNLGVYYFDTTWSKWFKVEKSAVDVEHKKIIFTTNHFTDFSVQPTLISDLTPQQLKDVGHSPFKTESHAGAVTVSPQGGTAMHEVTDFVLPGRNGFSLPIKRMYDTTTALADSPSLSLSASLTFNDPSDILDIVGVGAQLVSQGVSGLVGTMKRKLESMVKSNGDYALATGVGWRLNFPYVMTTNTSIAVRLPDGGYYNINQMNSKNDFWLSNPLYRTLEFEHHEGVDFRFKVTQARTNIDIGTALGSTLGASAAKAFKDAAIPAKTTTTTGADGSTTTTTTTGSGTTTTTKTDAAGNSTSETSEPTGNLGNTIRLVASLIPGWATISSELWTADGTHYLFDTFGRIIRIEDPTGQNAFQFHYDGHLLDSVNDDLGRTVHFDYNANSIGAAFVKPVVTKIWTEGWEDHDNAALPDDPAPVTRAVRFEYDWDLGSASGTFFNFLPTLQKTTDPLGRVYEYSYQQRTIVTGGGGIKINFLALILGAFGVPGVADFLGISMLTLSGHLEVNLPYTIKRIVAPGIGITDIRVDSKDLSKFEFFPTDYMLGAIPTALEVTYDLLFRLQTTQVTVTSTAGVVKRTNYDYHWSTQSTGLGKTQHYVDKTTIEDGRTRTVHRYDAKTVERNRFISWDDYLVSVAQDWFQEEGLTVRELYTLEEGNTTYDLATGRVIQTVANDWDRNTRRLEKTSIVRGPGSTQTKTFRYDNWGNTTYILDERVTAGRTQKTEEWNWYRGTNSAVPTQWTIGHLTGDESLANGDIRNLLRGKLTRSHRPSEAGGGWQDTYQETTYTRLGQTKSQGLWTGSRWATTSFTYHTDDNQLFVGAVATSTGPKPGQETSWSYDYSRTGSFFTARQTIKNLEDPTGTMTSITQETAYDWNTGWKLYDKTPAGYLVQYRYDQLGRLTDTLKPGNAAPLAAGVWTITHSASPWQHISYNDDERTATVYQNTSTTGDLHPLGQAREKYTYDNLGQLVKVEKLNPAQNQTVVTTVTYTPWGEVASMTDPTGNTTRYAYDYSGRLTKTTYADGSTSTAVYDDANSQRTSVSPVGTVTLEYLSHSGQTQQRVDDFGNSNPTTTIYYDGTDRPVLQIDDLGGETRYQYSPWGKPSRISHPNVEVFEASATPNVPASIHTTVVTPWEEFTYNDAGEVTEQKVGSDGHWRVTTQVYDHLGRVIKKSVGTAGDQRHEWFWYDDAGNLVKHADPLAVAKVLAGQLSTAGDAGFTVSTYTPRGQLATQSDPLGATVRYAYDSQDRKVQMKDPRANPDPTVIDNFTISYTYNDLDRLISASLPPVTGGTRTTQTIEYDLRGNPITQVDPSGRITTSTFDNRNRKTTQTLSAAGATPLVTAWGYDKVGNPTKEIIVSNLNQADPAQSAGLVTTKTYDGLGRLTLTTTPDGQESIVFYDTLNRVIATRDAQGATTSHRYNSQNKVTWTSSPSGDVTEHSYNVWGDNTASVQLDTASGEQLWVRSYTPLGQLAWEANNAGQTWSYSYTVQGQLATSTDPKGTNAVHSYTITGLPTQRVLTNGTASQTQTWSYDLAGALMTATDAGVTTKINQPSGSFIADPYDLVTSYSTTVGAKTLKLGWDYNAAQAPTKLTYPDQAAITYSYNTLGQLTTIGGYASEGTYNFAGRLTSLTAANGTKRTKTWNATRGTLDGYDWNIATKTGRTLEWDDLGNLTTLTKDGGTSSYQYDLQGRLVSSQESGLFETPTDLSMPWGSTNRDVEGPRELNFSNPGTSVKLDYLATSIGIDLTSLVPITKVRLIGLGERFTPGTIEIYTSPTGAAGSWTRVPGVTWLADQTGVTLQFASPIEARLVKVHSTWDERDENNQGVDRHTRQGTVGQLIEVFYQVDHQTSSYTYDSLGNRLTEFQTRGNTTQTDYTYYPATNLIQSAGAWQFNYDQNHNLISRGNKGNWNGNTKSYDWNTTSGEVWVYTWDLKNRLLSVQHGIAGTASLKLAASYQYDSRDLKVAQSKPGANGQSVTTWFAYDANGDLVYTESAGDTVRYVQALGQTWAEVRTSGGVSKTYYHAVDHLGSTEVITDSAGAIVWSGSYEAFGKLAHSNGTLEFKPTYVGRQYDADIGMSYHNARFYLPEFGVFINSDPIRAGDNWMAYTRDPLGESDPSGLNSVEAPQVPDWFKNENSSLSTDAMQKAWQNYSTFSDSLIQANSLNQKSTERNREEIQQRLFDFFRENGQIEAILDPTKIPINRNAKAEPSIGIDRTEAINQQRAAVGYLVNQEMINAYLEYQQLGAVSPTNDEFFVGALASTAKTTVSAMTRVVEAARRAQISSSWKAAGNKGTTVLAGSNPRHINGAIGEAHGYADAIRSGQIGIQAPGRVTATGPDFITFDSSTGRIIVWDSKYSSTGKVPSTAKGFGTQSWLSQTKAAIDALSDPGLRAQVQKAFQNNMIDWQIYKWPK